MSLEVGVGTKRTPGTEGSVVGIFTHGMQTVGMPYHGNKQSFFDRLMYP